MKKSRAFLAISMVIALLLSGCTDMGSISISINGSAGAEVVSEDAAAETKVVSEDAAAAGEESALADAGTDGKEAQEEAGSAEKNGEIYILYTSDIHCGIEDGFGFAGLYEYRKKLEEQGYTTILVDDGDAVQGKNIGTLTKGEAIIRLMNAMDYDVAVPGNHEFDYGMEQFMKLADMAEFPYISCNFNKEGELVFKPYEIIEAAGKKIGFVGLTTPQTLTTSTPFVFQDDNGNFIYGFLEGENGALLYEAVQEAVDAVRAEGADYVYAVGHMGNSESARPYTYADIISHTEGIDVFLDGHSHDTDQIVMKNKAGKEVPRSAVGTKMNSIGYSHITDEGIEETDILSWPDTNKTSLVSMITMDDPVSRAIAEEKEKLKDIEEQVVAKSTVELTINDPVQKDEKGQPVRMVRRAETNMGDFTADALRVMTDSEVGLINGGGVRDNIHAGDITYGDILSVFPFNNNIVVVEATGQQLLDALEWGARSIPDENGAFLQVSGLSYEVDITIDNPCQEDAEGIMTGISGERRVKNVKVGGEPLDLKRKYKTASISYVLQEHGDGQVVFDGANVLVDRAGVDNQFLIDYIVDKLGGSIGEEYGDPYGQGRITIIE